MNDVLSPKPKKPLYHYTTQAGLLGIIRDRQIWATHTQYLNDRREFLQAVDLVRAEILRLNEQNARPGESSAKSKEALNRMHHAISLSPEHINVCVCSFSEDSDSLSQWRAYGGSSGFAIGFSPEILEAAVEKQRFFLAKCIYEPATQLDIVSALVEEVLDEHLSKGPVAEDELNMDEVFWETGGNLLTYLYRYAPILKDRSFEEEREWRIISRPIFAQHFDFREGRSLIIPYYRHPLWEEGQKTEINEIVVGPTRDGERSIKSVSRLIKGRDVIKDRNLRGLDLGHTPVRASQVPYRDW